MSEPANTIHPPRPRVRRAALTINQAARGKGRNWEIYTLSDPRTQQVRYVGVTTRGAQKRYRNHLSAARHHMKTHCARWIGLLLKTGMNPILAVIERGTGKSRTAAERQWIALYRGTCRLTNLTDGGDGMPGHIVTPETRAKLSAAAQNMSLEWRAKISAAMKGRHHVPFSAEVLAKMSTTRKGRVVTAETRAKMSAAARNRSPEYRAKMSAAMKGKSCSAARRRAQKKTISQKGEESC